VAGWSRILAPGRILTEVYTCDYRFYLFDGPRIERIPEIEAYCSDCRTFVPSEFIQSPGQVEAQSKWLESLTGEERDIAEFVYNISNEKLLEARARAVHWARVRKSSPRCLLCGSVCILQPLVDERGMSTDRIMHLDFLPDGVQVKGVGFASTSSFYRLFDLEGMEIKVSKEELVEIVNLSEGRPVCATVKEGRLFYGQSFESNH
jgi:hypothetical protein